MDVEHAPVDNGSPGPRPCPTVVGMSLRRRMPAAALAALLALPLAACTAPHAKPTPTATSASTPLFSSDEEALKAATDAYAAYLKMSDTISHDGGADPERIKPYVTAAASKSVIPDFQELENSGRRTEGATKFRDVHLSRYSGSEVAVFLCSDVSAVRVFDSSGQDVTPASRQAVLPLEVEFAEQEDSLRIAKSAVWSGENFC